MGSDTLAMLLHRAYALNGTWGSLEALAQYVTEQPEWITPVSPGAPPAAPRCKHYLWAVSCGDTSCDLHGAYETKWAGRGPSPEREEDFHRVLAAAASAGAPAAARIAPPFPTERCDHCGAPCDRQMGHAFVQPPASAADASLCSVCGERQYAHQLRFPMMLEAALRAALAAQEHTP